MNKVALMQKVLGKKGFEKLIFCRNNVRHIKASITGKVGEIHFSDDRRYTEYGVPGKNVFFGYYHLDQYNSDMGKMLAHVVKNHANPAKDRAALVWIDANDKTIHKIAETKSWSWQQGARLRWHPVQNDIVLYNDYENGKYVTKSVDIKTGENRVLCRALYDLDSTASFGLSLNFDRLQRLRPGYGYSCQADDTVGEKIPEKDGVFAVDINSNKERLLFSLSELASDIKKENVYHYINHLSISPSGKRFMFFHIWTEDASAQWNMRFYVANNDGSGLTMLEDDVRVSHYCWVDDDSLLATRRVSGKEFQHVLYNLKTGDKIVNSSNLINKDGHPSMIGNGFITDTYPQGNMMQYIYLSTVSGEYGEEICKLFGDPICYGEHRCDLHPRVFKGKHITIDTTYKGKLRTILSFDLNEKEIQQLSN